MDMEKGIINEMNKEKKRKEKSTPELKKYFHRIME
jgi:hypothetical protein